MAKEQIIDFRNFIGLREYEDSTKASPYSAQKMVNMMLTDKGGLSKRPGVTLLGDYDTTSTRCRGFFVFRKTDSTTEIPMKAYDTGILKYYHSSNQWATLKTDYTPSTDFGFVHGFTRSGNDDYVYIGNKSEPDSRWTGNMTLTDGVLVGGESTITVDSVLRPDIYQSIESATLSAHDATSFTLTPNLWVNNQWIDFYVYIKAGTHIGKIRKITATTANSITFETLGSDPGAVDFEIRYAKFPASGTIIYAGTQLGYTAIPEHNKITVASAHAAADNTPLTLVPELFPGNPRGNRQVVLRGRRYIANTKSGMKYDSTAGLAQPGAVFVSKVVNGLFPDNDLTDFEVASPRAAGEGDIIAGEFGGAGHTGLIAHDNTVYMLKPRAIESVSYSQDTNDIAVISQIATSYGSIVQPIKGGDDFFFVTSDKQFTSLGRVLNKDAKETSLNIGLPVKRLLQRYAYDKDSQGYTYQNRVHLPVKNASDDTNSNRLLIYNLNGLFEGEWYLPIDKMDVYNDELYATQSNSPNVIKLYTGYNDVLGTIGDSSYAFPITSIYQQNWINATKSNFYQQEVSMFACEGYILGNTKLTFELFKDLELDAFLTFDFEGTDDLVDLNIRSRFLGTLPIGIEPLGAISRTQDEDGRRHFMFLVYFPFQHAEWFSWGFRNTGLNQSFEILRAGMNFKEDTVIDFANRIKTLNN